MLVRWGMMFALYLPQYLLNPFNFYTPNQQTAGGLLHVSSCKYFRIWNFAKYFYFPLEDPLHDLELWPMMTFAYDPIQDTYFGLCIFFIKNPDYSVVSLNYFFFKHIVLINIFTISCTISFPDLIENKYRSKRKEKNKSREEIFYQMKVFFVKIE